MKPLTLTALALLVSSGCVGCNRETTYADVTGDGKKDYVFFERTYPYGADITVVSDASSKATAQAKRDAAVLSQVDFPRETITSYLEARADGTLQVTFMHEFKSYRVCFTPDGDGNGRYFPQMRNCE